MWQPVLKTSCSLNPLRFELDVARSSRRQHRLTSKPCFSDGTHTSLFAAQSAWLAAENTAFEVGDPGTAPEDRKRVTSLAPLPVALDMVLRREQ